MSKFYTLEEIPSILKLSSYFENCDINSDLNEQLYDFPENFHSLLIKIFNFNHGKIPHLERLLCWFPEQLQKHFDSRMSLMFSSGPLPLDWRFFIAIMVTMITLFLLYFSVIYKTLLGFIMLRK